MSKSRCLPVAGCLVLALAAAAAAQFPDRLYYKLDEATGVGGTTLNHASPGVGSLNAVVTGHSLTAGSGQFAGGLVGATPSSTTNFIATGWSTNLPPTGWTISFWSDVSAVTPATTLSYFFGDSTALSFRCFSQGVAGAGNIMIRGGGLTDTIATGAAAGGPHVLTWVLDPIGPTMRGYVDGVLNVSVAQPAVTVAGTGGFRAAGYSTALAAGTRVDEFRVYSYALTAAEVAATWNQTLFDRNVLSVTQSAPGVGDLTVSLTNISPTATELWTLLSTNTSNTQGTGPFIGIWPDATTFFVLTEIPVFDGNPFHCPVPSAFGGYPNNPFVAPPGSVSSLNGLTFDIVTLLVSAGPFYDSKSNVVRHTFN